MQSDQELSFLLQEGEGYQIEFKEKLSNFDKEIVAFANSLGGSVFIGVLDTGEIKGIEITNALKSEVIDIAHNCDPSIKIELVAHSKERVLQVKVSEGLDKPYRCRDGFFLRIGPSSQKLKRDEIISLINSSGKIQFDQTLNVSFEYPKDFSREALTEFLKYCGIMTGLSYEDILINLGVAKKEKNKLLFTNAGILFFAKFPQHFFPESYTTVVRYASEDRFSILDKQDIYGNLITQIEQSLNFILRNITVQINTNFPLKQSLARHQNIYEYPVSALREGIINAVMHRDYYYGHSHTYIHIYPDYIDIQNPGGLFSGLTIEDLGKRSVRRNRLIADLLHHAKYIERVGSGFDRMERALQENHNPPLEVQATNFFDIRFYKRLPEISTQHLTPRQAALIRLVQNREIISKKDAVLALNISDDTAIRELNILLQLKLIKKTGKGKAVRYSNNA